MGRGVNSNSRSVIAPRDTIGLVQETYLRINIEAENLLEVEELISTSTESFPGEIWISETKELSPGHWRVNARVVTEFDGADFDVKTRVLEELEDLPAEIWLSKEEN